MEMYCLVFKILNYFKLNDSIICNILDIIMQVNNP